MAHSLNINMTFNIIPNKQTAPPTFSVLTHTQADMSHEPYAMQ